jgi:phosphoglycolate phosphatase-like HAD superfamily hydrolase
MSHVLFWDIDGTLLTTARAGVFALEEAAREICATEIDLATMRTAGMTDGQIAATIIREAEMEADAATVDRFLRAYERHLPERLGWRQGQVLPGVVAVLEDLRGRPGVTSLLLTGNTRTGATAKLRHYGLDHFFDGGAFCVDAASRESIARRALEAARAALGDEPDLDRSYVIGDTVHDVRCGKAIGVRTVAVATGPPTADELRASDPWLLLERLPDPPEFAARLELPERP